jgi:regulator of sigma E protease
MTVLRDGSEWSTTITPELDRDTGAGRIGVSAWVDPVLGEVEPGKSAAAAGLREGDLIIAANGKPIRHTLDLYSVLSDHPSTIELEYERERSRRTATLVPLYTEDDKVDLGLSFRGITRTSPRLNPLQAMVHGSREAVETFALTLKGIALLFSGVNVQKAVSGPVRITYLVGEVAVHGFEQGISSGFITLFRFLSLLSVALCFGNLLPIPALDGGFLVLSVVELIKGNSVSPRTFYRYQTIGFVIIILILFLTTFSDISYLFTN